MQLKKLKQVRTSIFISIVNFREYVADQGYGLDTLVRAVWFVVQLLSKDTGIHDILLANGETNEKVLERIKNSIVKRAYIS